ncbi:MAG: hypothetical protein CL678_14725 [Bdellovibrionaceae bacterium]|nr:hypothetical protein [Pseudobdellovibrionaceae bacterium]|tara:strand:- start:754 stop:1302 length:549 start_codon:yes stop_codon:yes gene_type:complete
MYVLEQSLNNLKIKKLKSGLEYKIGKSLDDVASLVEQRPIWYKNWAKQRFSEGNYCYSVFVDGKIVSCIWTSFDSAFLPNVDYNLILPENTASVLDGWTSPKHRKLGYYSAAMNFCLSDLKRKTNYQSVYFFIRPENIISLSIHKNLKVVLYLRLFKILNLKFRKKVEMDCYIESIMRLKTK